MCNTDAGVDYWVLICNVSVYVMMPVEQPHLFEQSEDVNGEEAHGGGDDEAGLLQVRHIALVGAHQIHHRIHQGVTSV